MKKVPTVFLRLAVLAMAVMALVLCIAILPGIDSNWHKEFPDFAFLKYFVIAVLVVGAAAFLAALFQTLKLLNYVDKNQAFSELSVRALRNIKVCGLIIGVLFAALMPLVYYIAQQEDAPGLILICGTLFVFTPIVIAGFTAVLQRLLQNAIDIKSENDLTV